MKDYNGTKIRKVYNRDDANMRSTYIWQDTNV